MERRKWELISIIGKSKKEWFYLENDVMREAVLDAGHRVFGFAFGQLHRSAGFVQRADMMDARDGQQLLRINLFAIDACNFWCRYREKRKEKDSSVRNWTFKLVRFQPTFVHDHHLLVHLRLDDLRLWHDRQIEPLGQRTLQMFVQ